MNPSADAPRDRESAAHLAAEASRTTLPLSQRDRMLAGLRFTTPDLGLARLHLRAQKLQRAFNDCAPGDRRGQEAALRELLGHLGRGSRIEPSFHCDYGAHIRVGDDVFINMNCTFLDAHHITIGNRVYCSPNVQILAVQHPVRAAERSLVVDGRVRCVQQASPVVIDDDVWIGAGAIVLPGVHIGKGCTVGAGSVVTRSLPPHTVAAGNPCRPLRTLDS